MNRCTLVIAMLRGVTNFVDNVDNWRGYMAFRFYLGGFELPVAPPKLNMQINSQNKTVTLANMKEINILKAPGLTDIDFVAPIPRASYPWANNNNDAQSVLSHLETLKTSQKPFQFIVSREYDNGSVGFSTNMQVGLEDYRIVEDAEDLSDVSVEIQLKQWVDYGAKVIYTEPSKPNKGTVTQKPQSSPNKPSNNKPKTYTVKHGDSLWEIAKKYLGDGSKYKQLYNMNKSMLDKRNAKEGTSKYTIYTGQVIRLG